MMLKCIKQHLSISEVQFIRKLRNAEAELNKTVPYKKSVYCTEFGFSLWVSLIWIIKFYNCNLLEETLINRANIWKNPETAKILLCWIKFFSLRMAKLGYDPLCYHSY